MENPRMIMNPHVENSLIGAILIDPKKVLPEAALTLTAEAFQFGPSQRVYEICLDLYRQGKAIDPFTVSACIGEDEKQEYLSYCLNCASDIPAVSHYLEYIEIIRETQIKNSVYGYAEALSREIQEGVGLAECQSLAANLLKCFDTVQKGKSLNAKEGYLGFIETVEEKKEYIKTGLSWIDRHVYLSSGDYMIVGGGPSSGKTALTLQMMLTMARTRKCVYFSLETSPEKIFERLVTCYAELDFIEVKQRKISEGDSVKLAEGFDRFKNLKLEVVSAAGWTAEQIKSKAVQAQAEIIFVDYLTLMKSPGKTPYERATQISMDLHTLAQQMGITVIALAQLNRAGKGAPDMTSLRESGQIEQDADAILLIHWPDQEDSTRELIIAKNKEGQTGKTTIAFDGRRQTFYEWDDRHRLAC